MKSRRVEILEDKLGKIEQEMDKVKEIADAYYEVESAVEFLKKKIQKNEVIKNEVSKMWTVLESALTDIEDAISEEGIDLEIEHDDYESYL